MLVVEQDARVALSISSRAYVLEVGRVALTGTSAEMQDDEPSGGATSGTDARRRFADFVQQVVSGLASGAVYALLALALVIIHRSTGVINFAQGEMATALDVHRVGTDSAPRLAILAGVRRDARALVRRRGRDAPDRDPAGGGGRPPHRDRDDRAADRDQRVRPLAVGRGAAGAPEPVRQRPLRHRRRRRHRERHRHDRRSRSGSSSSCGRSSSSRRSGSPSAQPP